MSEKGIFYGVSIGPGDPELMTLKAVKAIEGCDVIATPQTHTGEMLALSIAEQSVDMKDKTIVPLYFEMSRDAEKVHQTHVKDADAVEKYSNYERELKTLNNTIDEKNGEKKELEHQIRVHLNTISAKDAIITTLREEKSALSERIDGVDAIEAKAKKDIMAAREQVAEIETKNVALNNSLQTQVSAMKFRDQEIKELNAQLETKEATKQAEIKAVRAKYEDQIAELKAKYEQKITSLESEKVAACTFTDDQQYTIRLNAEKKAIQKDYDTKLAEATKKAKMIVKKARVLVDDKPQALLNLPEANDYR